MLDRTSTSASAEQKEHTATPELDAHYSQCENDLNEKKVNISKLTTHLDRYQAAFFKSSAHIQKLHAAKLASISEKAQPIIMAELENKAEELSKQARKFAKS